MLLCFSFITKPFLFDVFTYKPEILKEFLEVIRTLLCKVFLNLQSMRILGRSMHKMWLSESMTHTNF